MSCWTLITPTQLQQMQPTPLILDCRFSLADTGRGRAEYEAGHIPGARYAHLDDDLSGPGQTEGLGRHPLPDSQAFARSLTRWGWDGTQPIIAYDGGNGAIAARAWWLMQMAGHERSAVLDGGWAAWQGAGLPSTREIPAPATDPVSIQLDASRILYAAQLQQELADDACLLLDARARERFAGETEPMDPVAGHVPGAHNRPLTENTGADGRFKDAHSLREAFAKALRERPPQAVVHMCGSGVTACHNLLAMEHAGLPGSRLFAPSWSGWISDPERPVEPAP